MKTRRSSLVIAIATFVFGVAALIVVGCQSNTPSDSPTAKTPVAEKQKVAQLAAYRDDQGRLICPVMGTVIASEDKAFDSYDHNGVRYYFCCGGCPEQFKANPEQYLRKKEAPAEADPHAGHDH
jgi:YHS domain-containing protein